MPPGIRGPDTGLPLALVFYSQSSKSVWRFLWQSTGNPDNLRCDFPLSVR